MRKESTDLVNVKETANTQDSNDDGLMSYDEGTEERKHPTRNGATTTASNEDAEMTEQPDTPHKTEGTESSPEQAEENAVTADKTDGNTESDLAESAAVAMRRWRDTTREPTLTTVECHYNHIRR